MKQDNNKSLWQKGLGYMMVLALLLVAQVALAQITIKGHVADEMGEDIIGGSVVQKGTTNATITDISGNFTIKVPAGSTLVFSYVGYVTQEVKAQNGMEIVLAEDKQFLSEVVVVGYGAQKKESVIGAISQVSSKELLATPAANISQAISGKIPGVITSQGSGAPGADDASIYIRGRATFSGDGQPLVLVDGVERSFSQIAPDDIESISVLKDASATAVYGVRGANGVMLITTKRGKDQKPVVSLTANYQIQSPTRKSNYLGTAQSVSLLNEAYANDGMAASSPFFGYSDSQIAELPDVNWYDTVIKGTAPAQRYNINVRGGTKRMRYFVSGEYYNQDGLFRELSNDPYGNKSNIGYSRYAFRANLDFDLVKDLTFSVNFGTRFENRVGPNSNESDGFSQVFYDVNHTPSYAFPVTYTLNNGKQIYGGTSQYENVVGLLSEAGFYKASNTINETNFIADYKMDWLLKGLKVRGMMSFDYNSYYKRLFTKSFATYQYIDGDPGTIGAYNKFGENGELTYAGNTQTTTYKLYLEGQIYWANKFGKNDWTAMLLYNQNDYRFQADLRKRYMGLVGRVTYGYDDKYLAEVNFGYNGSENFRSGKRFGFFPAFSLGWRITQEKFMESTKDWLTNLKVRASYGQVGNDQYIGNRFLYQPVWQQINNDYLFGNTNSVMGVWEKQYANYDVTWEKANKYNFGLEFNLYDGLITGNLDYFYERRTNILTAYQTIPYWTGVANQIAVGNLGKTKNSGFEVELHHNNKIGEHFTYNVGFTFSHAKNEILERNEAPGMDVWRKTEGHPIGQFYGLVADGFITSKDFDAAGNYTGAKSSYVDNVKVGDLKYVDMNNDGFIDSRDQTFIGYSDVPENTYGLTLGCNWKGIGFNVMFQGVDHVSRYYDAEAMYAFVNGGRVREHHLTRWQPSMSEDWNVANAQYPLIHYDAYGNHNQQTNSFFLKNGAFMRLKNIEVSYDLPAKWIKKLAMTQCRVYVNANNLVTWDHLDDLADPESTGSNKYPIMKAVNFGVNVQF